MLQGVLFVAFSSRGHQLVFSYPFNNNAFSEFDKSVLADISTPKTTLCDKKFVLRVNNTIFIGHPTRLNTAPNETRFINSVQKSVMNKRKTSSRTLT